VLQHVIVKRSKKLVPLLPAQAGVPSPVLSGVVRCCRVLSGVFANDVNGKCSRGSRRRGHEFYYCVEGVTPAAEHPNFDNFEHSNKEMAGVLCK
jgi:hypothetical protein